MGTKEKMNRVGTKGFIKASGLLIEVKITDYKFTYGRERWQVTPVAGEGEVWVEKVFEIKKK